MTFFRLSTAREYASSFMSVSLKEGLDGRERYKVMCPSLCSLFLENGKCPPNWRSALVTHAPKVSAWVFCRGCLLCTGAPPITPIPYSQIVIGHTTKSLKRHRPSSIYSPLCIPNSSPKSILLSKYSAKTNLGMNSASLRSRHVVRYLRALNFE